MPRKDAPASAGPRVPQPFPYQGSKRRLAGRILGFVPRDCRRLVEPFAGSAAVSLAAAARSATLQFHLADHDAALIALWHEILQRPEALADEYRRMWEAQRGSERAYYEQVRAEFNRTRRPSDLLYLLARCTKAAVRYNRRGEFNNSADHRRRGVHPRTMTRNLCRAAQLLRSRTTVVRQSYQATLAAAEPDDVLYLDPPYQGVSTPRDPRYRAAVDHAEFVAVLADLNRRRMAFLLSYDGATGDKRHAAPLPDVLQLVRLELPAGRSAQATLLGRTAETVESLYLSPALVRRLQHCGPLNCEARAGPSA